MQLPRKLFVSISRVLPSEHHDLDNLNPDIYIPEHKLINARHIPSLHMGPGRHCGLTEALMDRYGLDGTQRQAWYSEQPQSIDIYHKFRNHLIDEFLDGRSWQNIGVVYNPHQDCDRAVRDIFGDQIDCVGQALNELFMDKQYSKLYKEHYSLKKAGGIKNFRLSPRERGILLAQGQSELIKLGLF